jgi:hypothetical protein
MGLKRAVVTPTMLQAQLGTMYPTEQGTALQRLAQLAGAPFRKPLGWEFDGVNKYVSVPYNAAYMPSGAATFDVLVAPDFDMTYPTGGENEIVYKKNGFVLKVLSSGKYAVDLYTNPKAGWTGATIATRTPFDLRIIQQIPVESYGVSQGITTDGQYIYTTNDSIANNQYRVMKRNLDGSLVAGVVATGMVHPSGCCYHNGLLYVAESNYPQSTPNRVWIFNTSDLSLVNIVNLPDVTTGQGVSGVAYYQGNFYFSDYTTSGNTTIYVYTPDFQLVRTFTIPCSSVQGIDIYAGNLWVMSAQSGQGILKFDLSTLSLLHTYKYYITTEAEDIAITRDGRYLYFGDKNTIWKYEPLSGPALDRITATFDGQTINLYRNGVLEATNSSLSAGSTINNDASGGLVIASNGTQKFFKGHIAGLKIMNVVRVPSSDIWQVCQPETGDLVRYDFLSPMQAGTLTDKQGGYNGTAQNGPIPIRGAWSWVE